MTLMKDSITIFKRPLSPHISIYRWPITMIMSIAHRISGGALYSGTFFFAIWLISIACGEETFHMVNVFYNSLIGRITLFVYTFALIHHLIGGLRHLFWDINTVLLEKHCATKAAVTTLFVSLILTVFIWIAGCAMH